MSNRTPNRWPDVLVTVALAVAAFFLWLCLDQIVALVAGFHP